MGRVLSLPENKYFNKYVMATLLQQMTWVNKIHQRPKFRETVLYGRPGQNKPTSALQLFAGDSDLRVRVADAVAFVQENDAPSWERELAAAAAHLLIGDKHHTRRVASA